MGTAAAGERSKSLHNFSLPCSWGNTKVLRCMKVPCDSGIEVVREKLMSDLRVAANNIKVSIGVNHHTSPPWNLRTRRAACNSPNHKGSPHHHPIYSSPSPKSTRFRASPDKHERPRFSITLSKHEIEDDFFDISGVKPARRPKKRPRTLQKQLDLLFPGSWLSEVTLDAYKVAEIPDSGKG